jgi:hypothetical protein
LQEVGDQEIQTLFCRLPRVLICGALAAGGAEEDVVKISTRSIVLGIGGALVVPSAIAIIAQGRTEPDPGSLAALTAEIRQLRLAVEDATRSQTQTQALGVYLSAQQSRLVQVSARADAARKELDAVALRSREIGDRLAAVTEGLRDASDQTIRLQLEDAGRELKREQASIAAQQVLLQGREDELSQMLQVEHARWTDLISRLEQLIKK